jgi:hypothetical protein
MKTQKNPLIQNLKPITFNSERTSKMKPQNNSLTYHLTPLTLLFERSKKMKRSLLLITMFSILFFWLSSALVAIDSANAGLSESFTGTTFPPDGWTVYNFDGDDAWSRYTSYYHTSPACARIYYDSTNNDWLITPRLSVVANDSLKFYYRAQSTSYTETLLVRASTSATVSDTTSYALISSVITNSTTWTQKKISLSAYVGQNIYIAFVYQCSDQYAFAIDDVTGPNIFVPCLAPNITCPNNETRSANGNYTTSTTWTATDPNVDTLIKIQSVTLSTLPPGITSATVNVTGPPLPAKSTYGTVTYTVGNHCLSGGAIPLIATNNCTTPLKDTCTFNVTLTNNPPVANCPGNATFAYNVGYSGTATATDPNGDAVTFSKVSGPAGLNVATNGAITWTTGCGDVGGPYTVVVRATDVCGATNTCSFQLTVTNAAPTITCPPNDTAWVGLFISGNFTKNDPEGRPITVSFVSITPPATNNPTIVGNHVEWLVSQNDLTGVYTIRLRVTDECGLTGECTFTVTVVPTSSCSEPNDLGICDTMYVEPFNGDDIYQATGGYDSVRISIYVTHDSNTIPSGPYEGVQDSIAGFVIPLKFWKSGCADSIIFPTYGNWNNKIMDPDSAKFNRSMFRHLVDPQTGDTVYNRFALMHEEGLADWIVNTNIVSHDSGHVFLSLLPFGPGCRMWSEGSRELLATLTFLVYMPDTCESTAICLDSTFWPPSSRLEFGRYDAVTYIPRHFLPENIWFQQVAPEEVYAFNDPENAPPDPEKTTSDGFDNNIIRLVFQKLGLTNDKGKLGKILDNGKIVDPDNENIVLGEVIKEKDQDGKEHIIGYRSKDGKKEAYDLNKADDIGKELLNEVWKRVKDGGEMTIGKHGLESSKNNEKGGGIKLDESQNYDGVTEKDSNGRGTDCRYGPPYELEPRPGAQIKVRLKSCHSSKDPDGDGEKKSVKKTFEEIPGVGEGGVIEAYDDVYNVTLEISKLVNGQEQGLTDQEWEKLYKDMPDAYKKGLGENPELEAKKKAIMKWISDLPLEKQWDQVSKSTGSPDIKLHCKDGQKPPKDDTLSGVYHHCPIMFSPDIQCTTEYFPDWSCRFFARLVLPTGSLSTPTVFHLRQLAELPAGAPSGWRIASGVFDFRDVGYEPVLLNPAFVTLAYFGNKDSLQMFRFDDSLVTWVPAGGTPVLDTVNKILTVDTWRIGIFAVFSPFMRGDPTRDGVIDASDVVYLINYLFINGPAPVPLWVGDATSDGVVDVSDVVYVINYLFVGGPPPSAPVSPGGGLELYKGKVPAQIGFSSPSSSEDGIFNVPVMGKFDSDLSAVQLEIKYDPEKITLLEPALTSKTEGLTIYSSSREGILKIGILDLSGKYYIFAGTDVLVNLKIKGSDLNSRFASLTTSLEITKAILVDRNAQKISVEIVSKMKESEEEFVGEKSAVPQEFSLFQNYPNPFNPETEIKYALPKDCEVQLVIYNVLGQKVKVLVDEHQIAGYKNIHWNGRDDKGKEVASGVYFYKLQAGDFSRSRKMLLLR